MPATIITGWDMNANSNHNHKSAVLPHPVFSPVPQFAVVLSPKDTSSEKEPTTLLSQVS